MISSLAGDGAFEDWNRAVARMVASAMPDMTALNRMMASAMPDMTALNRMMAAAAPDTTAVNRLVASAMPDLTALNRMMAAAAPDTTAVNRLVASAMPDMTAINRMMASAMPDMTALNKQVEMWTAHVQSFRMSHATVVGFDKIYRAAAMTFLVEGVPKDVAEDAQWRIAANEWLETHALALFLWLAAGVITVLFCTAAAVDYELVDQINTALATPGVVVGIGLAVWALSKKK